MNSILAVAAILGFLSVLLGAFAAHGLRAKLPQDRLALFQTGVQYQMYHALALLGLAVAGKAGFSQGLVSAAAWFFVAGIVVFSGSLYLLALTGVRRLGAITPIGGLLFLIGWIMVLVAAFH